MNTNDNRYMRQSQVSGIMMRSDAPNLTDTSLSFLPLQTQRDIQTLRTSRVLHTNATTAIPSSFGYHSPELDTSSVDRSKNAAKPIAEPKLQPPMWEWSPFLLGLPVEIQELILSKFEFQLPSEGHNKVDSLHITELLRKRVSLKDSHPMNTLAATSRSMRDIIEAYCDHLLETHRKNSCNKCLSTDEKSISSNLSAFTELAGAENEGDKNEVPNQAARYVMLNNCLL